MSAGARIRRGGLAIAALVTSAACCGSGCRTAARGEIDLSDALEHLALGDSAAALRELDHARYELPHDDRVLFHYARLRLQARTPEARAQAEKALREALDRKPANAAYLATLGILLHDQGFHHESMARLGDAVRRDPAQPAAWYALGLELLQDWREDPGNRALTDSTLHCFEWVLATAPDNDRARAYAVSLLLHAGRFDAARIACAPVAEKPDCAPQFSFLMAAVEFRRGRFDRAQYELRRGLDCATPDERADWTGIRRILPEDSVTVFDRRTSAERDSMTERFWWDHDATPTTQRNERLLEHVDRLVEADLLFEPSRRHRRGRDTDRGDIWVRWGRPERMGLDPTAGSRSWHWLYTEPNGDVVSFTFLDRYLNGDYVRLDELDFSRRMPLELYPERSQLDLGAPPPPWAFRASRFRGVDGGVVLEIAYEVRLQRPLTAILVEATGWRGVGRAAGTVQHTDADAALVHRSDGRTIGRVRLEIAPPVEALGIELREVGNKGERPWRASERRPIAVESPDPEVLELSDLMPAYSLREGRPSGSRWRDAVVVPCVDSTIAEGHLHVYFEVYPPPDAVGQKHALRVTYRVRALPPAWRFRDQFGAAAARARAERRIAVESTFEIRARAATEPQTLSVDLRRLSAGPYRFEVEVRDVETGETARRSLALEVPKPAVLSRSR